eukprot:c19439_g1_i1 orf=38-1369(+)
MACAGDTSALLPGLPNELGLLCLAKLPIDAVARCRAVSRSWASALGPLHYPAAQLAAFRLPQPLACLCTGSFNRHTNQNFMAWLLFSPSSLCCHVIHFFNLPRAQSSRKIHIRSSQTQVIATGTSLLLVRSRLEFTGDEAASQAKIDPNLGTHKLPKNALSAGSSRSNALPHGYVGLAHNDAGDRVTSEQGLGALQGFDLWRMKWCRDLGDRPVPSMHVDRWEFATAHVGQHVYVAGGNGPAGKATAKSVERLNMETGRWEMLPEMFRERSVNPAGFVMGGCFFVAGGEFQPTTSTAELGLTQSGEFFDPEKGRWTLVEGMWPEELWGSGEARNVVVVKEVAYTISGRSEVLLRLRLGSGGWEVAGRLPYVPVAESSEQWMLVKVGKDELWAILYNSMMPHLFVVACKPLLAANDDDDGLVHWVRLPFTVPQQTILSALGIHI